MNQTFQLIQNVLEYVISAQRNNQMRWLTTNSLKDKNINALAINQPRVFSSNLFGVNPFFGARLTAKI